MRSGQISMSRYCTRIGRLWWDTDREIFCTGSMEMQVLWPTVY